MGNYIENIYEFIEKKLMFLYIKYSKSRRKKDLYL